MGLELSGPKPSETILNLGNPGRLDILGLIVETLKQALGKTSSILDGQG